MTRSIDELLSRPDLDDAAVGAFLAGRSLPIADAVGITFIWRGEADQVYLHHWVHGLTSANAFQHVPGTSLWWLFLPIPRCSRVEYKFEIVRGDEHQLVRDPANPALATDPFGANSVASADGYARPDFTLHDPRVRAGELIGLTVQSEALDDIRRVTVYQPARFRPTARYPLLIVHDGSDYLDHASLATVLDNLIERHELPPMIVACCDPGDRLREYAADPRHGRFIVDELLPRLAERWPLVDRPDARGILGASFGAVAALATAWRHPGTFGRVLLQSGSFAFTDIGEHDRGPLFDPVVDFVNAFRDDPGRFTERVFLSCGTYERLIYENRSLVPRLAATGMKVRFEEARDGHNWENWRDRLRVGLSWLFPGPLWMVYE